MKRIQNRFLLALGIAALAVVFFWSAKPAAAQGPHPHYIHALSDLRHARWLLNHQDEWNVERQERDAVRDIDSAISQITAAAINDGKNTSINFPTDAGLDYRGRLHRARQLLDSALNDLNQQESNPGAQGWQAGAISAVQRAHGHIDHALRDKHWDENE